LKKSLRIGGISMGVLLVLTAAVAVWALHTESGTRAVLALARGWLPPGLTFAEVRGTIAGTLHIRNFRYRDAALGLDLSVESATVDLAPLALLAPRLHVEKAEIDGIILVLFAATAPQAAPPPTTRNPWEAPLDMRFDEVQLTRGELRRAQSAPLLLTRARVAGAWTGAAIEARELVLENPDGQVTLSARIGERAPKLEDLKAKFRWHAGEHTWDGTLAAAGGREHLALDALLEEPVKTRLTATLARAPDKHDSWRAHLAVDSFDPRPLIDAFDSLALELDAEGDTSDLALRGALSLGKDRINLDQLVLAWREQVLQITSLRARLNSQPATLTGSAKLALDGSANASALLAWDEFNLPEVWAGANFRSSGKLALTASGERFAANASVRLARAQRYSTLTLRLNGTRESLNITELELTQMPGALSVAGQVDLRKPMQWNLRSQARAFDPALFLDAWPGALDFDLDTTGRWPEAGPHANFKLARLGGKLRGRAISGSGDISLGPDLKPSGRVALQSGGASVDAVASAAPRASVTANIRIASLQEWRKDLSGSVHANIVALGRWPNLEVQAHADASGFRGGGIEFESAKLRVDGRDARSPAGSIALDARGLDFAGFHFDQASAALNGNSRAHRLELDARGPELSVALAANGALERAAWSGVIESLRLDVEKVPALALQKPARLAIARDSLSLEMACLSGGDIALCAAASRAKDVFTANYSIRALPLSVIAALAAPDAGVAVEGLLEGSGELRRAADGTLSGHGSLGSANGAVSQGDKEALRLAYRDFKLEANLASGSGIARLHGTLIDQGELDGTLSVGVNERDPSLNGKASLELKDLAPLAWWVPQLAKLQGKGSLSAEIGGTIGTPRVALTVTAREIDAEVPLLGLQLRDGHISAKLEPDGAFEAGGGITSGDGTIRMTGSHATAAGVALHIDGSKFLAANIPGARVSIAPDLTLTGKPGDLALKGTVTIEDADVNLEKLSIARSYSASPDVVVVDREQQRKRETLGLTTDVRIVLGKDVKLAGYGLESTVAGELRVTESPNDISRAFGEIRVAGTYEAFGRKLNIERGRLQYAGTALDDPQLDILAVRKLQDVTAKLRVTGTAQNPKLDVSTDPGMSQTDAMSYLLTGKPASDLHGEDGAAVQGAAQSLGGVLGNRLAKKIGGKVGFVDEIGVEQNTDLGGSAFTVGKYLSPRLFVSYGIGLFEPGNAVTVRYQFSERWSLEANDTPEDQHAGVRYRIEK
jgi:translocation and assembly module TamB